MGVVVSKDDEERLDLVGEVAGASLLEELKAVRPFDAEQSLPPLTESGEGGTVKP